MTITFDETTDPVGLEIHDAIEQRYLSIESTAPVSIDGSETTDFCFPVDRTCAIETDGLRFDQRYSVTIHDSSGRTEQAVTGAQTVHLEDRPQFVGLSAPIKLYFRIDPAATIDVGLSSVRISLDREATIDLGVRSLHDQPAGTITTPPDLDSMLQAISALPSALKTTSPERTWPTLRGHPPLIELGDRLEIPSAVDAPDNDITLVVPPEHLAAYQAAPLAFFLGATVRSGRNPRLETSQFERPLAAESFGDEIADLFRRFFFCDCLTRTEGLFRYELLERSMIEDDLPFDLAATYDEPLSVRLERYLEVPFDLIEPHLPRWPLTAHLPSDPESVEVIPFVVNELGLVREARGRTPTNVPQTEATSAQLVRSASTYRSSAPPNPSEFVVPAVTGESIEHAWFGDGIPQHASKATIEAYRSELDRGARNDSIKILLVCNDVRMLDEHDLLGDAYGNREALPFDVRSEFGVDSDQLASLLTEGGYDFLHYIGHATEDGIRCTDGELDVRTLESVDLGVFFLNACRSYEQGLALTRRGAFGGVSTYSDVINEDAVEAGEIMARLLNRGFPLRGALEIVQENAALGDQYLIVGDGSTDIAQSDGGSPGIIELEDHDDDTFGFAVRSYSTKEYKLGTSSTSNLATVADRHLTPGITPPSSVDKQSLREYLTWTELPFLIDDQLHWNDGITPDPFT
ncbi:hypothetical protein [Halopiger aswanensis]|uniref:CHAT domain-containing protein n=1 Tax=Halopiger aswanensis TaxID=148449 RepID=A0A3R7GLN0_9EURY|nr:hypothetical protein [Halopiger aswanensis]RKD98103.1 hypothetical protein ATJ93_1107 [Halopiger aswanensis]